MSVQFTVQGSQLQVMTPAVSCVMATWNRPRLARLAVQCFLAQNLAAKELIVLDDSDDWHLGWLPAHRAGEVTVVRLPVRMSRGQKWNLGMEYARAPVVALWADDDWQAPWRLSMQLAAMQAGRAEVCGMDRVWWHDLRTGETWRYSYTADGQAGEGYVVGGTLMFRREFWQARPFVEDWDVSEDNLFIRGRVSRANAVNVGDESWYVAFEHGQNAAHVRPRDYGHAQFRAVEGGREIIEGWGCDVGAWEEAVNGKQLTVRSSQFGGG